MKNASRLRTAERQSLSVLLVPGVIAEGAWQQSPTKSPFSGGSIGPCTIWLLLGFVLCFNKFITKSKTQHLKKIIIRLSSGIIFLLI